MCIIISFVLTFDVCPRYLFLFTFAFIHQINKGNSVRKEHQLLIPGPYRSGSVQTQRSLLHRDRWAAHLPNHSRLCDCSLMGGRLWEVNCRCSLIRALLKTSLGHLNMLALIGRLSYLSPSRAGSNSVVLTHNSRASCLDVSIVWYQVFVMRANCALERCDGIASHVALSSPNVKRNKCETAADAC